jgi:hypothetical protein
MNLLNRGLEDVILLDPNLDLLVGKIHTLVSKKEPEAPELSAVDLSAPELTAPEPASEEGKTPLEPPPEKPASKTRGRLTDINLVDLIQILGQGRRTVRLTVRLDEPDTNGLVLYLDQGHITCANTESHSGAEAVYDALQWTDGTWTIEPIAPDGLPSPNNDLSNEAILMEGCRALDEKDETDEKLETVPVW